MWHKDTRRKAGGSWRCFVRRKDSQRRYEDSKKAIARTKRYEVGPVARARAQRHYHAPMGGWYTQRKQHLAAERGRILDRLAALTAEEANLA